MAEGQIQVHPQEEEEVLNQSTAFLHSLDGCRVLIVQKEKQYLSAKQRAAARNPQEPLSSQCQVAQAVGLAERSHLLQWFL